MRTPPVRLLPRPAGLTIVTLMMSLRAVKPAGIMRVVKPGRGSIFKFVRIHHCNSSLFPARLASGCPARKAVKVTAAAPLAGALASRPGDSVTVSDSEAFAPGHHDAGSLTQAQAGRRDQRTS